MYVLSGFQIHNPAINQSAADAMDTGIGDLNTCSTLSMIERTGKITVLNILELSFYVADRNKNKN